MNHFSKSQLQSARKANLYDFLMKYHNDLFHKEGQYIRFLQNHSICIKRGYSGYCDYETSETGNAIDFLTKYLSYQLDDAVFALTGTSKNTYYITKNKPEILPADFPEPVDGRYRNLFAYLMSRKIDANIIQLLIDQKLLYQEKTHNNMVFINKDQDFAEIHGTVSFGKSYHSCCGSKAGNFWCFNIGNNSNTAYICEAAIDAISLYQITKNPGYYISISGVGNQEAINRIRSDKTFENMFLAVDNDAAGQLCRDKNSDIKSIIPRNKDWNEDLIMLFNLFQE